MLFVVLWLLSAVVIVCRCVLLNCCVVNVRCEALCVFVVWRKLVVMRVLFATRLLAGRACL